MLVLIIIITVIILTNTYCTVRFALNVKALPSELVFNILDLASDHPLGMRAIIALMLKGCTSSPLEFMLSAYSLQHAMATDLNR